jgi:hypothetical protein
MIKLTKERYFELFKKFDDDTEKLENLSASICEYIDENCIFDNSLGEEYIDMLESLSDDVDHALSYWLYDCCRDGVIKVNDISYKLKTLDDVWAYIQKQNEMENPTEPFIKLECITMSADNLNGNHKDFALLQSKEMTEHKVSVADARYWELVDEYYDHIGCDSDGNALGGVARLTINYTDSSNDEEILCIYLVGKTHIDYIEGFLGCGLVPITIHQSHDLKMIST